MLAHVLRNRSAVNVHLLCMLRCCASCAWVVICTRPVFSVQVSPCKNNCSALKCPGYRFASAGAPCNSSPVLRSRCIPGGIRDGSAQTRKLRTHKAARKAARFDGAWDFSILTLLPASLRRPPMAMILPFTPPETGLVLTAVFYKGVAPCVQPSNVACKNNGRRVQPSNIACKTDCSDAPCVQPRQFSLQEQWQ